MFDTCMWSVLELSPISSPPALKSMCLSAHIFHLPIHLQLSLHLRMEIRTFPRLIACAPVSSICVKCITLKMNIPVNTSSHCTSVSLPARISPLTPALAPSAIGLHSPSLAIFISIPRRTGSPIPKLRRRAVILNSSCVDCQAARRASRGWVEAGLDVWEADERDERRVSWIPGAEGAPVVEGFEERDEVVFVVVVR